MIRTFNARRILFTPVSWLNSVANWLLGIHSDSGTIKITNTASPGDTGPSVDVDIPTVAKKLDTYLKDSYPKVRDKKLLGASLKWENGQLEVDDNWLKARVIDDEAEAVKNSSEIASTFGISITPDYTSNSQAYLNPEAWKPPVKMTGDDDDKTACGWERGKTAYKNGVAVDATHAAVGCSIKVCSHAILRNVTTDGTKLQRVELFFTNLQFDANGRLIRAIPATDWFTIPHNYASTTT